VIKKSSPSYCVFMTTANQQSNCCWCHLYSQPALHRAAYDKISRL